MKKLILLRHGDENLDGTLTPYGEEQMRSLIERLKPYVEGQSVLVFSSIADRAIASAAIITQALGVSSEATRVLGNAMGQSDQETAVLTFIRQHQEQADVLVLVCHTGTVGHFPEYYLYRELGKSAWPVSARQGEAVLIDIETKALQVI